MDGFKAPRGRPDPKNRPTNFRPDCLQVPSDTLVKAPKRHIKAYSSDPGSSNKTAKTPSEISRGRWPFGREPPVKRRTPFPINIPLCSCVSLGWVPEGSLAGIFWRHEMALELVCRADFWCNRHCRTSPVLLEGLWGQVWPKTGRKPTPEISGQTAFRYPVRGCDRGGVSVGG